MAAEVVQQAWLTLKEYTWSIPISRVELQDQKVVAYEDGTAAETLFSNLSDISFPDQVAKHALLSAVERADEPTPETGAAEDLVQLRNQFRGPELDLVLAAMSSMNLE
ncbi:unnamed protein product [Alternaria alternata]